MTVDQDRLYQTDDAQVWAEEFMREFGDRKDDIDEGLMIGWFANAIETAKMLVERSEQGDTMTEPQMRVLDFLYRAGWASPRTIAKALYGNRSQAWRADLLVERLHEKGLIDRYLRTAWTLTDEGRQRALRLRLPRGRAQRTGDTG